MKILVTSEQHIGRPLRKVLIKTDAEIRVEKILLLWRLRKNYPILYKAALNGEIIYIP